MSSGRPRRNAQVDRCFYIYLKIQIPKPTDKQYGSLWSAYLICHGIQPFRRFVANKITRIMKWGISPSREMPHFFVYFSTRTIMVCLLKIRECKIFCVNF